MCHAFGLACGVFYGFSSCHSCPNSLFTMCIMKNPNKIQQKLVVVTWQKYETV